jgi:putative SOS response-associated peptidase YedK
MPLIVQPEHYGWWISGGNFEGVLAAPDKSELNWQPLSRELNNVRNEGAALLRPLNPSN